MVFCNLVDEKNKVNEDYCHNPYFNRWFSAIAENHIKWLIENESQSLF